LFQFGSIRGFCTRCGGRSNADRISQHADLRLTLATMQVRAQGAVSAWALSMVTIRTFALYGTCRSGMKNASLLDVKRR